MARLNVRLEPMHIAGELNSLADLLSRTVQSNSYRLDSEWFATHVGTPDFDLTGRGLHGLRNSVSAVCERKRKRNSGKWNSV